MNPGATEICNGIDDDCDGLVDDDDPSVTGAPTMYVDRDGDGFGDPSTSHLCNAGPAEVADGADCDDLDSAVHPGAAESCDRIDQNCDAVADEACTDPRPGLLSLAGSWLILVGDVPGTWSGVGARAGGGSADPPVLFSTETGGLSSLDCSVNRSWLYDTLPAGREAVGASASAWILGDADDFCIGASKLDGDSDADGYADVLNAVGSGYLFRGPLAGAYGREDASLVLDAGTGAETAAWLGDIDGVPGDEIGLGQPHHWMGWESDYNPAGMATIFSGLGTGSRSPEDALATIENDGSTDILFGLHLGGVGDLDGDGLDDVSIKGSHYFFAPVSGALRAADADIQLATGDPYVQYTYEVRAGGDIDGDGTNDAVVGAAWDWLGGAVVLTAADTAVEWVHDLPIQLRKEYTRSDESVCDGVGVGDFDGDGETDIAIGGAGYEEYEASDPRPSVYVEYGPFAGIRALGGGASLVLPEAAWTAAGMGQLAAADFDADGLDDLFVGTVPDDKEDRGVAYLWLGVPR